MYGQEQHEMQLEKIHSSGAEEWFCPTCGRRFIMRWPPAYEMVVLEQGDLYANHSGSKGGLRIGTVELSPEDEDDEENLRPWKEWLDEVDFDAWWDDEAA